jgi:hypothetical protein
MRRLLFAALLLSLLGVLLLAGLHRAGSTPPIAPTRTAVALRRQRHQHLPPGARRQVRHFIAAFLSYEVGRDGRGVAATIRACASPRLARQLLSQPPTSPGRPSHGRARITSLHINPVPGEPDLVLASGDASRPEGPEPFSFLIAQRDGRWLALAPGE